MQINNNFNVSTNLNKANESFFSTKKQGSEGIYLRTEKAEETHPFSSYITNDNVNTNIIDTKNFNGFYNMFLASQALKSSEILNTYNHKMALQSYTK